MPEVKILREMKDIGYNSRTAARRRIWVTALRSKLYMQTFAHNQHLRDETGFSPFGVACDISGLGRWVDTGDTGYKFVHTNDVTGEEVRHSVILPGIVVDWLGLPDHIVEYFTLPRTETKRDSAGNLVSVTYTEGTKRSLFLDVIGEKMSFDKIADVIERDINFPSGRSSWESIGRWRTAGIVDYDEAQKYTLLAPEPALKQEH